jgi:hypothetical protein
MNRTWSRIRRSLVLLAIGGSTFAFFGTSFGIDGGGCNYALNQNYSTLFQAMGDAAIKQVSDNVFGTVGTDFDAIVRTPTTAFAQSLWNNWVTTRVPRDIELK